jgi:hypothetical protein
MSYMTESCIVVIPLGAFESEVVVKCLVVERNISSSINQSIAKKLGATF